MARILRSYLNPMMYTEVGFTQDSHYASKHIDDHQFADTIRAWEQQMCFGSVWAPNDVIRHQFISGIGPINIKLVDADDISIVYDTEAFQQKQQNADIPGEYIYENDYDISGAELEKRYRFLLTFGSPVQKTFKSEPFILSENIENTLYLQYSHYKFRGDVIFETGIVFYKRIRGSLKYNDPNSKDTFWEDQELNQEILDSKPYDTWDLYLSDEYGIPPYFIKRLNWILGCSELLIDGRYYAKADGSKLEKSEQENYPMTGYKITMRERLNRSGQVTVTEGNPNERLAVVISVDSKGFGTDTAGLQTQITDVE
jgi:hypothetical protein